MPIAKVQVRIPWTSIGLGSSYQSTNVLSFDSGGAPITQVGTDALLAAVIDCYEAMDGLYGELAAGEISATLYDMSDPPEREPVNEAFGTFTPAGSTVPPESTCLVTFKAAPAPLVTRRKRRGRVNVGPLSVAALNSLGAWSGATITTIADAFETMATAVNGLPDYDWVAGSEANGYFPIVTLQVSSEPATLTTRQSTPSGGVEVRAL